ncbi:hypothetical protein ERJ75_001430200 [Trypanosoma vivax]|nr:hypothetical protein ERJ75_001430200 [Trypanosoma vivax]
MADNRKAVAIPVLSEDPNGRKNNEKKSREAESQKMTEEDERIKNQVEVLVTRAADSDSNVAGAAIRQLEELLLTNTGGSVASVPKPLKYVRSMYAQLERIQKETSDPANAMRLHDILSFVAMTIEFPDGRRAALEHKLQGTQDDLEQWGHEYLRYLSGCISAEWKERTSKGEPVDHLSNFVQQIVVYMVAHQDEPTAIDLLMEVEDMSAIISHVTKDNHRRIANYLAAASKYLTRPMDTAALKVVYNIYLEVGSYTEAVSVALQLGDRSLVETLFQKCQNPSMRLQMALTCAHFRLFVDVGDKENRLISEAMGNMGLSRLYRQVAEKLDFNTPLSPESVFKTGTDVQETSSSNESTFKLASAFVSGLVNCGFGKDTYLTEKNTWLVEHVENRLMVVTSMLGFIYLWDHVDGLLEIDKYLYSEAGYIKAGACLATGVSMCGVTHPSDPALGMLYPHLESSQKEVKIGAILGLGYAYVGSMKEDIKELLIPILADSDQAVEVQCMAAYALSLVFVASMNEGIIETMDHCLREIPEDKLKEPAVSYLVLALGFLFLGKQEAADTLLDATQTLSPVVRRFVEIVVRSCAYAATGNVVVIQNFFHAIAETDEPEEDGADGSHKNQKQSKQGGGAVKMPHLNHRAAAVLGIGLVAIGEEIGTEMVKRSIIHALLIDTIRKGEPSMSGRHAIPFVYALLSASNPNIQVVEALNRLSHDSDVPTAINAIVAMGIVAAGTNNASVASKLRNLAAYYKRDFYASQLVAVRLAQGFTMMGRGNLTLSPLRNDRSLVSPTALVGLIGFLYSLMNNEKTILGKYSYMLLTLRQVLTHEWFLRWILA